MIPIARLCLFVLAVRWRRKHGEDHKSVLSQVGN